MSQPIFQCCPIKKTKSKKKPARTLPSVNEVRKIITNQKKIYNDPKTNDDERDDINDQMVDLLKEIRDIVKDEIKNITNLPKFEQKNMVNQVVGEYARDVGIPDVIINKNVPLAPPPPMVLETAEEKENRLLRAKNSREKKENELSNPVVQDQRGNLAREAMMAVKAKKKSLKERMRIAEEEERMRIAEEERMRIAEEEGITYDNLSDLDISDENNIDENNIEGNNIDEIIHGDKYISGINQEYYNVMEEDPEVIYDENILTENLINNKPFDEMIVENENTAPITKDEEKELTSHLIKEQLENLMMTGHSKFIDDGSF
jgi:hypothetical protein